MVQKAVFISSLAHSGSTMLDLLLGAHPKMVGLGEVYTILNWPLSEVEDILCTCNSLARDCVYWGDVLHQLNSHQHSPVSDKYKIVAQTFYRVFGDETILVDSSKLSIALQALNECENLSVSVVRLSKDVRAFTISHMDILGQEIQIGLYSGPFKNKKINEFVLKHTIKTPTYLFWKWYLRSRFALHQINQGGFPHIHISYEELCFEPEKTLQKISEFIGVNFITQMLVPAKHQNHILTGNPMRRDPKKLQKIKYDNRWLYRSEWILPAAFFPFIMRYNARKIYKENSIF